jgi:hypothetical protein
VFALWSGPALDILSGGNRAGQEGFTSRLPVFAPARDETVFTFRFRCPGEYVIGFGEQAFAYSVDPGDTPVETVSFPTVPGGPPLLRMVHNGETLLERRIERSWF